MSVSRVRDVQLAELPAVPKAILMHMVLHVNSGDDSPFPICYPSIPCLVWESGYSLSTVKRELKTTLKNIARPVSIQQGRGWVKGFEIHLEGLRYRLPWKEEKSAFLKKLQQQKRGSHRTPLIDQAETDRPAELPPKGVQAGRKGVQGEPEKGSARAQKGFTVNPELDLSEFRSSESEGEQEQRASRAASPPQKEKPQKTKPKPKPVRCRGFYSCTPGDPCETCRNTTWYCQDCWTFLEDEAPCRELGHVIRLTSEVMSEPQNVAFCEHTPRCTKVRQCLQRIVDERPRKPRSVEALRRAAGN